MESRRVVAVLLLALILGLWGCGGNIQSPSPHSPSDPADSPQSAALTLSAVTPSRVMAQGPNFELDVTGTDFSRMPSTIYFGGNALSTTLVSDSALFAIVPASMIATPASVQITVRSPGYSSKAINFQVFPAVPSVVPSADTLGPTGTRQFAYIGFGSGVSWSIAEGAAGGTITSNGYYTAPGHTGTFHVIATSLSDSSKSATAILTITSAGFAPTGAMSVPRSGHTATLLNDGRVLILGGGDSTAELFDPGTGTFSFTGPPVVDRIGASATLLADGKVLIAGGLATTPAFSGPLPFANIAEIFDPATGSFHSIGRLIQPRWAHAATLLADGRVLIAGGAKGLCFTASTEVFDPATGTFSPAGFMLSQRIGHTATLLNTGEVLIAGGANGCRPDAADDPPWNPLFAERFDPTTNSFQGSGNMSTTRIGHSAIRLLDGKVLVMGGIPKVQNLHQQLPNPSYSELYDPAGHTFSSVPRLSISHESYTATLLRTGMVLIVGGQDAAGNITANTQLLNPSSRMLTATGGLGTPRIGHTATLLQDGRVLVVGGSGNGKVLASAELYQ